MTLAEIHESNINGQLRQVADQIEEYGVYDFFHEYDKYLEEAYFDVALHYYTRATKAYIRKLHR